MVASTSTSKKAPSSDTAIVVDDSATPVEVSDTMSVVATVGVAVVGAAILEAAFIPAILIGAAAALAPRFLPSFGTRMAPVVDSTVKGAVKLGRKARGAVGQFQDRLGDISAEVAAEEAAEAVI